MHYPLAIDIFPDLGSPKILRSCRARLRPVQIFALVAALILGVEIQPVMADSFLGYENQMPAGALGGTLEAGIHALGQRDFDKADALFRKALSARPDEPHALALIGEVAVERGKPDEASPYFHAAADKNPHSAVAQAALGGFWSCGRTTEEPKGPYSGQLLYNQNGFWLGFFSVIFITLGLI